MNRVVYNIVLYLLLPFLILRLVWRALRTPDYGKRWPERFGFISRSHCSHQYEHWIWVHAVSVGESIAAVPLIRRLRREYPDHGIVVTSMTPTGAEQVRKLLGEQVCHAYAPYDYIGAVKRFLKTFRPTVVVLIETELWPNLVYFSKQYGAQVLVANARLSEKSFRGYQRFGALGKPMLQQLDCIAAQSEGDRNRFLKLGIEKERLRVTGSIKFEAALPSELEHERGRFVSMIEGQRPVWIAASTRDGEEEKVLEAFRRCLESRPELLLILVPRHPERFRAAHRLCRAREFSVQRRSEARGVSASTQILLGDSMGEMLAYYGLADLAFVGGSLVDTGCQNVLEPAAMGLPVITGPSQYNFQSICDQLREAGALAMVADPGELADTVMALLDDPQRRVRMGRAGSETVTANRGALERTYQLVREYLPDVDSGDH